MDLDPPVARLRFSSTRRDYLLCCSGFFTSFITDMVFDCPLQGAFLEAHTVPMIQSFVECCVGTVLAPHLSAVNFLPRSSTPRVVVFQHKFVPF